MARNGEGLKFEVGCDDVSYPDANERVLTRASPSLGPDLLGQTMGVFQVGQESRQ